MSITLFLKVIGRGSKGAGDLDRAALDLERLGALEAAPELELFLVGQRGLDRVAVDRGRRRAR